MNMDFPPLNIIEGVRPAQVALSLERAAKSGFAGYRFRKIRFCSVDTVLTWYSGRSDNMSIVSSPFTREAYSPSAQTEQELAYELLSEPAWSEDAYLVFSEAFNRPIELSDGRLVILPMPSLAHQRILRRFVHHAQTWLAEAERGEIVFAAHPIRLWPGKYREPDAMIWLKEHKARMGERESGPPDLVVEIVSPSNEPHDADTKVREYAQAGIPEYWIIQPQTRNVSVYTLEGHAYRLVARFDSGQRAHSLVLSGFELAINELLSAE
jgi:Uma2 family endonuclease